MRIMLRTLSNMFMALSALCFAVPALAQGEGAAGATNWVAAAAGIAMAIAAAGCGIGQGRAAASATEGIAKEFCYVCHPVHNDLVVMDRMTAL